jgi:hypothetical protein
MDPRVGFVLSYYARERQPQHVQAVCNELLRRAPGALLQLWRARGLLAAGAGAEVRAGWGTGRAPRRPQRS